MGDQPSLQRLREMLEEEKQHMLRAQAEYRRTGLSADHQSVADAMRLIAHLTDEIKAAEAASQQHARRAS